MSKTADGRGIWFQRAGWSFTPCHWKGWALLLAICLFGAASGFAVLDLLEFVGHPELDNLAVAPFALAFVPVYLIIERHSPPA
jgi:hypothetical protein